MKITKKLIEEWADIDRFANLIGFRPTRGIQPQAFDLIKGGERIIDITSGYDAGKTYCSVVVAVWRALQTPQCPTLVINPTLRVGREIWLKSAVRILHRSENQLADLFSFQENRITIALNKDWTIKLVACRHEDRFQGYHDIGTSYIIDDSNGIPPEIKAALRGACYDKSMMYFATGKYQRNTI